MDIKEKIKLGLLDLNADKNDRFVFFVGDVNIPLNYIISSSFNKIRIARAFASQELSKKTFDPLVKQERIYTNTGRLLTVISHKKISPNTSILNEKCKIGRISPFSDGIEIDVSFKVRKITPSMDELWCPNRITLEDDIWLEVVTLEISSYD